MRRAAVSISSNLAEGSARSSRPDFARFVEIANGSLFEVVSQATISKRQEFLPETDFNQLYSACEKQSKMLSGLRRSLLESLSQPSTPWRGEAERRRLNQKPSTTA
jgi:four helix bundle protein